MGSATNKPIPSHPDNLIYKRHLIKHDEVPDYQCYTQLTSLGDSLETPLILHCISNPKYMELANSLLTYFLSLFFFPYNFVFARLLGAFSL